MHALDTHHEISGPEYRPKSITHIVHPGRALQPGLGAHGRAVATVLHGVQLEVQVHGGEQKVAYLRTAVWTEDERDLFAEIGTDDGLKVWWNDALVLENNTQRAVAPGQEKVRLRSIRGWNRILIKVTQNIMGWGACVRLTQPDGSPVVGLRIGPVGWAE